MSQTSVDIPSDLLTLKPSDALESISMSTLARSGTAVLQRVVSSAQAVAVKVQGKGAMVTLSQQQYDEMVGLIQRLQSDKQDDGFEGALRQRFDELAAAMNRPGAAEASRSALFAAPDQLSQHYQPGTTEDAPAEAGSKA
jgi:hypothetical protein